MLGAGSTLLTSKDDVTCTTHLVDMGAEVSVLPCPAATPSHTPGSSTAAPACRTL